MADNLADIADGGAWRRFCSSFCERGRIGVFNESPPRCVITYDGGAGRDVQVVNFGDLAGEGDMVTVTDGGAGRVTVARAAGILLGAFSLDIGTVEML